MVSFIHYQLCLNFELQFSLLFVAAGFFSDDDVDDAHDIYSENNNETKPRKKASQAARNILMDWLVEHQSEILFNLDTTK